MKHFTEYEIAKMRNMNDEELQQYMEDKDKFYKIISYIDKNKKAKLHTKQGNIMVEYLGGYLYTILVYYAHNRKILINAKTLYQYLREHEEELSIIEG